MDLLGKNVVFVGGFGGIGIETCKELMKQHLANLVILDLNENSMALQALKDIDTKCKVSFIRFDITSKTTIRQVMEAIAVQMKYIDILVNGAGIIADRNVERTININLIGLINTTFGALPYMDKTRNGRGGMIVNIASVLGLEPCGSFINYCASKHGVIGFTRSLADPYYYNRTGVAAMAICPGITTTPLLHDVIGNDTFDYSKPLTDRFLAAETQSAEACGGNVVKTIMEGKNNSIWILDRGSIELVSPQVFWKL